MNQSRERDLAAYYDAEAEAGARSELSDRRLVLHGDSVERFRAEGVRAILDVGAGSGLDLSRFRSAGFAVTGVDLSAGNASLMASNGFPAMVGSVLELPLLDDEFDVVWTMSTLVHIGDDDLDRALGELRRVCRPGGLLAIGSWGSRNWEGTHDFTRFDPPRFFSLRDHDRWRRLLERYGIVERYDTFVTSNQGWDYQFALLRV